MDGVPSTGTVATTLQKVGALLLHVRSFFESPAVLSQPDVKRAAADGYGSLLTQSQNHLVGFLLGLRRDRSY